MGFSLDHVSAFSGFDGGFVDAVELEESTKLGADFFFHMTIPPIGGQAVGAVCCWIEGDVIGAMELDDIGGLELLLGVATGSDSRMETEPDFA